ncbi:MAG: ABC transporter substrate-binding protein [Velocimicrobium sp.]
MKKIRKFVAVALATTMVFSMVACSKNETKETQTDEGTISAGVLSGKTVGFAQTDSMSSWRTTETDSIKKSVEEAGGEFIVKDAGGDIATQESDIRDLAAAGVDYLIVAPLESNGLQGALEEAMENNIPVILVDRAIDGEAGTYYTTAIMSDFLFEGAQCAKALETALPDGGNIVIINGGYDSSTSTDRQAGFVDALDSSKYTIIAEQDGEWLMDKAQSVMENIIQAQGGENIDVVFAVTDDMIQGAKTAIEAAGLTPGEDILTLGIDGTKAAFEDIEAGKQLASCTCSPYFGPIVVATIAQIINGTTIPADITNVDTLYTIDNVAVDLGF